MQYYIVQKIGYQYNDEVFQAEESGTPQKVFKYSNEAQDHADKLSYKEFLDTDLNNYCYCVSDVLKHNFIDNYNKIFNTQLTDLKNFEGFPKTMTFEQYQEISSFIKLRFFEVVPCEGN